MSILSIQSQVVTGHVGNSAAVPALQLRGHDVWPIPTTLLSHHPGHGGAEGAPTPPSLLTKLLDGIVARGGFAACEAVISGYLATAATAAVVTEAVSRARAANPRAIYLCDPVLGDDGRLYVAQDIAAAMHSLAASADILTPNATELAHLTGQSPATRAAARQAMQTLQAAGPGIVVLTSFAGADTPPGTLDVIALDGPAAWTITVPRLSPKFSGAGDLFAALFLSHWLASRDTPAAAASACAALHEVLTETARRGGSELALLEARHQMFNPGQTFVPEPLA